MVMYVNDFETQRNETTYTPLYISYCRSFPAFFFFWGDGAEDSQFTCNPVLPTLAERTLILYEPLKVSAHM